MPFEPHFYKTIRPEVWMTTATYFAMSNALGDELTTAGQYSRLWDVVTSIIEGA